MQAESKASIAMSAGRRIPMQTDDRRERSGKSGVFARVLVGSSSGTTQSSPTEENGDKDVQSVEQQIGEAVSEHSEDEDDILLEFEEASDEEGDERVNKGTGKRPMEIDEICEDHEADEEIDDCFDRKIEEKEESTRMIRARRKSPWQRRRRPKNSANNHRMLESLSNDDDDEKEEEEEEGGEEEPKSRGSMRQLQPIAKLQRGANARGALESSSGENEEEDMRLKRGQRRKRGSAWQRPRCSVEGCATLSQRWGLCSKHGGFTRCSEEGCDKQAQKDGLCIAHGGGGS